MPLRPSRSFAVMLLGFALGLAWNALSGRGLALTHNVFIRDGDEVIEAAEAKLRLEAGALFLDARPLAFYEMEHVAGALPLPEDDFEPSFKRLEPKLRTHFDIVVYCSGYGCEASHIVSRKLKQRGIPAAVLHEGWPAWLEAGYPTKAGKQP